jgi:50S ribosomal protein L16 3-hydroxylase
MSDTLAVLDALPAADDFYTRYWNAHPFLVRGAVNAALIDRLIAPEELAALSMEETARARLVSGADWSCRLGPFAEDDFSADRDDAPWSLLVQNVDQFHPDTADLLRVFDFAPRWLMDDVMVSFSTAGGGIGGHVDRYHVFLVQGHGRRRWTIGRAPITDEVYLDGLDLKILKDPVDGETVEVGPGDVLYVPPRFAHEGTTLEDALTFSVGFLGPQTSDLLEDFGLFLADNDTLDDVYVGAGLGVDSAGFVLSPDTLDALRERLSSALSTPAFEVWLASFLTASTSVDAAHTATRDDALDTSEFTAALRAAGGVVKPAYVKFALVPSTESSSRSAYTLGVNRRTFRIDDAALAMVLKLMAEEPVPFDVPGDHADLLCALYNLQALEFAG